MDFLGFGASESGCSCFAVGCLFQTIQERFFLGGFLPIMHAARCPPWKGEVSRNLVGGLGRPF